MKTLTPENILKSALDEQQYSSNLMGLTKDNSVIQEAQHNVELRARPFLNTVLALQQEKYKNQGCQRHPWDQVLPLFTRGYAAAQRAESSLKDASIPLNSVIIDQEKARRDWNEALRKLQEPLPHEEPERAFGQVLHFLQEMEQDDLKITPKPIPQLQQEGWKPW